MELYDMLDRKQAAVALDKFKSERKFIGENVDVQVFNTLEQAIMKLAVEMASNPAFPASGGLPVLAANGGERIERAGGHRQDQRAHP